ncbi:hypothetical protein V7O66_08235 [Methanolobus sp. ZRKC3]|uniref:hypothetical protein n=1 Tax=Methanolobus sp. ZRKC3 TaxID=3125786 RepID=UPI003256896A
MNILSVYKAKVLQIHPKSLDILLKLINIVLMQLHLVILKKEKCILPDLIDIYTNPHKSNSEYPAECIIFSMDRAIQLHALLCSYFENVNNSVPVHVLYRTSSSAHQKAYNEVFSLFEDSQVSAVYQKNKDSFKDQLIPILESVSAEKVFFLVDDIVFTEDLDIFDFVKFDALTTVVSLRMGANLKRAYTTQKDQKLPPFIPDAISDKDKLCWIWKNGELDWSYPLSVDGHLFLTREIIVLAKNTSFNSPNTFEGNLQGHLRYFKHRHGICYQKSKIINLPINKVQDYNNNIHGTIHQDYLLDQWNRGMQIDYRALYGFVNESAQQEIEISFVKRNGLKED